VRGRIEHEASYRGKKQPEPEPGLGKLSRNPLFRTRNTTLKKLEDFTRYLKPRGGLPAASRFEIYTLLSGKKNETKKSKQPRKCKQDEAKKRQIMKSDT
jgi:hypothetical protein